MIDRIRQDIQERLDQLLAEADRLRQALSALGGERTPSRTRSSSASSSSRARSSAGTRSRAGASRGRARSTASRPRASSGGRAASGGTKNAVLKALTDANGQAMTASEVAAATGLGRASVSTTLSKLARAGDVNKADRGYRLTSGAAAGSNSSAS
jgi:biotin operon repressor